MKLVAGTLFAVLVLAIPCPSQKPPQDARSYYNELHDSGSAWNKGNRFNRVCFGEKHDSREAQDIFDATNSFLLVGFWGEPPATICKEICLLIQPFRNPNQVELNASDVRQVNRGTITRADGQLYAPFSSGAVQALFDKINKQTKRPRRVLLRHGRVVAE
jgi:hypothetical protein